VEQLVANSLEVGGRSEPLPPHDRQTWKKERRKKKKKETPRGVYWASRSVTWTLRVVLVLVESAKCAVHLRVLACISTLVAWDIPWMARRA
jgi:hypothetical protein